MLTKANVAESAAYLKEKLPFVPEIALVLGSGIGPLAAFFHQIIHLSDRKILLSRNSDQIVILCFLPLNTPTGDMFDPYRTILRLHSFHKTLHDITIADLFPDSERCRMKE